MTTLSSAEASSQTRSSSAGQIDARTLQKFREQVHALGGVWIFMGTFVAALGVYLVTAPLALGQAFENLLLTGAYFIAAGGVYVTLGVFSCLKKLWAVQVGLLLTYLSLASNLLSLKEVAPSSSSWVSFILVMLVGIILQCHRVISWAKQLRKAGLPLTARPHELR